MLNAPVRPPKLKWSDYASGLAGIAVASIGLGWQIFGWPAEWQGLLPKIVAIAVTVTGTMALQVWWLRREHATRGREARRAAITEYLNLARSEDVLSATKSVDARLNVMKVHPWWVKPLDRRTPNAGLLPRAKLYMFACTSNIRGGEAGLPWGRENGCAGELWASRDEAAWAVLRDPADIDQFNLSAAQRELTTRVCCIVSLAVYDGIGSEQRLAAILNLDSLSPGAADAWFEAGELRGDVRERLRRVGDHFLDHGWLD